MFLGLTISLGALIVLGLITYTLLVVQILIGLRVIKLGKVHRVWHRRLAWAILAVATVHGLGGMAFYFGWRIL